MFNLNLLISTQIEQYTLQGGQTKAIDFCFLFDSYLE